MPGRIERSRRLSGDTRYGGHGESVKPEQKKGWEDQGTPACQEPLKAADQILYKLRVEAAVETQHDILESGVRQTGEHRPVHGGRGGKEKLRRAH
jgi:hypothetical protein